MSSDQATPRTTGQAPNQDLAHAEQIRQRSEQQQARERQPDGFWPRGTLLFLLVMLLGYALYWAYLWFIVVIERGAGGA